MRPFILGLAGGIGSGKSTVAAEFARLGCRVIDFDHDVGEVLKRPEIVRTLVDWWGPSVVRDGGRLDRRAVASIVFANTNQRERLEALVHPLVWRTAAEARREAPPAAPGIIFDAPVLFESGLDAECDAVAFVEAPAGARLERVRVARNWTEADLTRREEAQIDLEVKKGRSRFVIHNEGDLVELQRQVGSVFAMMVGEDQADEA